MPIYEYKCRACEHCFEALVIPQSEGSPECPSCESHDLEQLISAFMVNSESTSKASFAKAKKKAEKTIVEQKIGVQEDLRDHH